jgi:hypothetical protein
MGRLVGVAGMLALAAGLLASPARAGMPDDDLSVVRRATHRPRPAASPSAVSRPALAHPRTAPRWLKVRVVEEGRTTVTVNLPLGLVRALGDRAPTSWICDEAAGGADRKACSGHFLEALATLEPGQDLVLVNEDARRVRVWVE